MTLQKDSLILLDDVINKINTRIGDNIKGRINFHSGNKPYNISSIPNGFTVSEMPSLNAISKENMFSDLANLNTVATVNKNNLSQIAKFNEIYNKIISAFDNWSRVRTCVSTIEYNGGAPQQTTGIGVLSTPSTEIVNGIKNKADYANKLLRAGNYDDFVSLIYNTWANLQTQYTRSWHYKICHSSCHNSCHCHFTY